MDLGFTGNRHGLTLGQFDEVYRIMFEDWERFHHGDCVGADAEANGIAHLLQIPVILHPPTEDRRRAFCRDARESRDPLPYLERNKAIVNESTAIIACPEQETGEKIRSGTWSTVRYAERKNKLVWVVRPSGRVEER